MGERGCQAPVHCTLPKLLCPILCRVGGARWRLSGLTVLAPSTGGEAAHLLLSGGSSSGGSCVAAAPEYAERNRAEAVAASGEKKTKKR